MRYSELHLHLDGSLSLEDFRYLAKRDGVALPHSDAELKAMVTFVRVGSLDEYLKRFELPLSLLQSAENVSYATASLVKRLKGIGVEYAEIRFAPCLHTKRGAGEYEIAMAALEGFKAASEECGLVGGIILCCMRGGAATKRQNLTTAQIAAELKDRGIIGLDLAGNEAADSPADYGYAFGLAREAAVNITIHAGEDGNADKVRAALDEGATRIGHGVRAAGDKELVAELRDRGITLELCYTSNLSTGAASAATFPLRYFISQGVRVTLNSDNMTVSDTDIRKEVSLCGLNARETLLLEQYAREARFNKNEL